MNTTLISICAHYFCSRQRVCYQPTSCLIVKCLPCSSHWYCQVQSGVIGLWWSGGQHPGWAGVSSSRIKITLQIIAVVLSFKNPPENDIFTFPTLRSLQNVIAFFISKPSGRGGGGIFDVHVTATGCAPHKTQDRRLNK